MKNVCKIVPHGILNMVVIGLVKVETPITDRDPITDFIFKPHTFLKPVSIHTIDNVWSSNYPKQAPLLYLRLRGQKEVWTPAFQHVFFWRDIRVELTQGIVHREVLYSSKYMMLSCRQLYLSTSMWNKSSDEVLAR